MKFNAPVIWSWDPPGPAGLGNPAAALHSALGGPGAGQGGPGSIWRSAWVAYRFLGFPGNPPSVRGANGAARGARRVRRGARPTFVTDVAEHPMPIDGADHL